MTVFGMKTLKASPLDRPICQTRNQPSHSAQGFERLGSPVDNGSLPIRVVGRLPGPLNDQHGLGIRGMAIDLVFKPLRYYPSQRQRLACSVYTWTSDTAEGV